MATQITTPIRDAVYPQMYLLRDGRRILERGFGAGRTTSRDHVQRVSGGPAREILAILKTVGFGSCVH
jgi:hypothetical protein